jgi:transketolase
MHPLPHSRYGIANRELEPKGSAKTARSGSAACSRIHSMKFATSSRLPLMLDEYDYKFELGKAKLLRDGKDVLVIASGFMTMRALEVADQLRADNVDVAVLHVPTIKPLDDATILAEVKCLDRVVVVAENHSVIGGLGEATASLLLRSGLAPKFRQIALPDAFLDAGALPTLHDRYGISTDVMAQRIGSWL